jgi:ribonuclease BN (tRNA processing enzyme)
LIGARGTVPTSEIATVSFLVDNRYLFDCPSEIVQAFHKYRSLWKKQSNLEEYPILAALGKPTFGKIKYIILSHLHFDHWGGIAHIIHRILLLEREKRRIAPLTIIIPENSTIPFQKRMKDAFRDIFIHGPLSDSEFLYQLLSIEVGDSVRSVVRIKVIADGETVILDPGYRLLAKQNDHLPIGSFSYKLEFITTKLNVKKAKKLGIPFNQTLKRIEKSKKTPIRVGASEISRSDIFFYKKTILGYSGDTRVDPELISFFSNCQILLHESTYLTQEKDYHLDSHSDILSLIKEVDTLVNLKALIPIHFSIRYSEEEITNCLSDFPAKSYCLINPIETFIVQIGPDFSITNIKRSNIP